jgi:hypothetical protein
MGNATVQMTRLQGEKIDPSRLQDNINQAIAQVSNAANAAAETANAVTPEGIAAGQFATVSFTAVNQSVVIANPLGQKVQGIIVVNLNVAAALVINPNQGSLDPTKQVRVTLFLFPGIPAEAPVSVGLWFF